MIARKETAFFLPGYVMSSIDDNDTHQIEKGSIVKNGVKFDIVILRPAEIAKQFRDLPFLVAQVTVDGKTLWDYKTSGSEDYGILADTKSDLVVAMVGKGKWGKVKAVVSLNDLVKNTQTPINRTLKLKEEAADYLGREVQISSAEEKAARFLAEKSLAEQSAQKAQEAAARERTREERRQALLNRPVLNGFTQSGHHRYGIPVVGNEWECLPHGSHVVLVEAYKPDEDMKMIESFIVKKVGGSNPQKLFVAEIFPKAVAAAKKEANMVKPLRETMIHNGNNVQGVKIFASMDEIRRAQAEGLNGGSYVAVAPKATGDKIEVHSVTKDSIRTIGHFNELR